MADITQADVDAAQGRYEKARAASRTAPSTVAAAAEFADLRRRWREQEIDAGRRVPGPTVEA